MIFVKKHQKSISLRLILLTLTIIALFTIGPSGIAYATTLEVTGTQDVTSGTEEEVSTDGNIDNNTDNNTEGPVADPGVSDQEQTLGEGYYIDEQGQVCYDESLVKIEEPIIEDISEEDTEKEAAEVAEEVKEDTLDTADSKADDKKEQTKEEPKVKKPTYTEEELRLLACLVYAEAGNQSYKGMLAVSNVVLNRVKSDVFWHVKTIKDVIYDHKWAVQFSVTIKNKKNGLSALDKALKYYDSGKFGGVNPEAEKKAMQRAIKAAKDALEGKNNIGNYLCFTRTSNSIKKKYSDYKIIGDHIFYRTK